MAVRPQESTLGYGELDRRANQLAHRLIALGVGADVPVGVMIPRSLDAIVAVLGVLKAGGAFIPMDPSYPSDRLAMMLEDSQVSAQAPPKVVLVVKAYHVLCSLMYMYHTRAGTCAAESGGGLWRAQLGHKVARAPGAASHAQAVMKA